MNMDKHGWERVLEERRALSASSPNNESNHKALSLCNPF
jgi:hypothetical protein